MAWLVRPALAASSARLSMLRASTSRSRLAVAGPGAATAGGGSSPVGSTVMGS